MSELKKLKNSKLIFIYKNFLSIINSNGLNVTFDVIEYIEKIKSAKSIIELNETKLVYRLPDSNEGERYTLDSIYQFIETKISSVYYKYLLGSIDFNNCFEKLIMEEISKINNNQIENTVKQKLISEYLNKVEVL